MENYADTRAKIYLEGHSRVAQKLAGNSQWTVGTRAGAGYGGH